LATDLIWLAKAGHVIEFADGTLDLPLPPRLVESEKGNVLASNQAVYNRSKVEEASSHEVDSAISSGGEAFEEVETSTAQEVDSRGSAVSTQKTSAEAMEVEVEKNDEGVCAAAGSPSHLV
jgi:hypothetical protein